MAIISGSSGTFVANNALNSGISQATNAARTGDFDFFDMLDIVNPLQHVPIVSHLYRAVTGDVIDPIAQVIGGGVFGGVPGAISSAVQVAANEIFGSQEANQTALNDASHAKAAQPNTSTRTIDNTNTHQKDYGSSAIMESDFPMTAHAKRMQARMAYWA